MLLAVAVENTRTLVGLVVRGDGQAALVGRHGLPPYGGRVGGAAAGAADRRVPGVRDRGVFRRTACAARVARRGRAVLPGRAERGGRAGREDRAAGAGGQPARGRHRPDRQRPRGGPPVRRSLPGRRRRYGDHHRRGQPGRRVHRRSDCPGHRNRDRRARHRGRPAAPGRAGPAAVGGRQEHGRSPAVRRDPRFRRPGRRSGRPGSAPSSRLDPATVRWSLTGALAPLLAGELATPIRHEPLLTLHGLQQAFARNN